MPRSMEKKILQEFFFFFFVYEREELVSGTAEATGMENLKDPPRRLGKKELSDWQRWRFPLRVWTGS